MSARPERQHALGHGLAALIPQRAHEHGSTEIAINRVSPNPRQPRQRIDPADMILGCRWFLGDEFETWGWRVPFLLSIILLAISVYIRMQLEESPVFREMRAAGKLAKNPLRESLDAGAI